MTDKPTPIVEGPSASSEHRTPATPATFSSPLGSNHPDIDAGTLGAPLGESGAEAVGAAPKPEVVAGSPAVPSEPDATGVQPGQSDSHLQQRADAYDWLMQDPAISAIINENVAARLGQTPQAAAAAAPQQGEPQVTRAEFDQMKADLARTANEGAQRTILDFQATHPDFVPNSQVRNITGAIVRQYGLPLEQAYHLANVQLNGGKPVAASPPATAAPAEAGPGGGGSRTPAGTPDVMEDVLEQVERLPQSPRRFEDALGLVIKAAQKKHAND